MRRPQGAQIICFQELFYGPVLLPGAGHQVLRLHRGDPRRADHAALPVGGQGARHGDGAADVRDRAAGHLLQHRGGHRRRRHATSASTASSTSRRSRGSGRSSTSSPATAGTRSSRPPSARSACTSATTATSPRAGGRSASTAPRSCSTRRRPAVACRSTSGGVEQPAAAVANMYYVGAINRVGIEAEIGDNDFYGQSYFVDPEGKFVGDVGDAYKPELIVRDLDMDMIKLVRDRWAFYRDRRPDAYDELVRGHERTRPWHRTLINGRHGRLGRPGRVTPADVLIDGETIAAVLAPGQAGRPRHVATLGDRHRRSTPPASTSCPGGVDVHTHMQLPFGGTEASDTFETGTAAAAWGGITTIVDFAVQNTGGSVQDGLADWHEQGRRQLRHRLRLPPDHRRRRRGLAEGDDATSSTTRASPASSCSWPTPACSTPTTARSCGRCRPPASPGR